MAVSPRPQSRPVPQRRQNSLTPAVRAAVAFVCVFLIAGVGYFVIYPYARAAYHGRQAEQALADRDFPRAQEHLTRILELRPNAGEARFLLARTYRRSGDLATAQVHLKEAGKTYWDKKRLDLERLLLQAQTGAVGPVEQTLRGYLAAGHADEKYILEALVIGNLDAKSPQDAYQWSCLWLERYPDDWQARYWKGLAYKEGMRHDLAAEELEKVLEQKPGYAEAHLHLAEVLAWKGRYAEAAPHFRAYLVSAGDNTGALLGLARCQRSLGESEASRQTLERLFAGQPDHAGGLLLRGQLELDSDNPAEALTWLRRAHEQKPNDMDANQALAAAFRLLNQPEAAQDHERRGQEIKRELKRMEEITKEVLSRPRDVAPRYEAGTILMRLGQQQEAAHWLVSALLLDRKNEATRKALAECLQQLGDPKLLDAYRPLLEDVPENSPVPRP